MHGLIAVVDVLGYKSFLAANPAIGDAVSEVLDLIDRRSRVNTGSTTAAWDLKEADQAIRLLTPPKAPPPPPPPPTPGTKGKRVTTGGRQSLSAEAATAEIGRLGRDLTTGQKLTLDISWKIEG